MKRRGFIGSLVGCLALSPVAASNTQYGDDWLLTGMRHVVGAKATEMYYEHSRTGKLKIKNSAEWRGIQTIDNPNLRLIIGYNNGNLRRPLLCGKEIVQDGTEPDRDGKRWARLKVKSRWIGEVANPEKDEANEWNWRYPHRGERARYDANGELVLESV